MNTLHTIETARAADVSDLWDLSLVWLKELDSMTGVGCFILDEDLRYEFITEGCYKPFGIVTGNLEPGDSYKDVVRILAERGTLGRGDVEVVYETAINDVKSAFDAKLGTTDSFVIGHAGTRRVRVVRRLLQDRRLLNFVFDLARYSDEAELLGQALQASGMGFWTYDHSTGALSLSEYFTDTLTRDELVAVQDEGLSAVVHPDDKRYAKVKFARAVRLGEDTDLTFRVVTEKSGTRTLKNRVHVKTNSQGEVTGAACFVRDVSEEERIERLQQERETARCLARQKTDFIARLTHEIRTPLNGIIGMTEALKGSQISDDARHYVKTLLSSAQHLEHVLGNALDGAKLETGHAPLSLAAVNIRNVLRQAWEVWSLRVDRGRVTLHLDIGPNVPEEILLDTHKYQQCLNNLLSNAIKFTHEGRITLSARLVSVGEDCRLLTSVRDTGIGMTEEECEEIFEPYRQANSHIGGEYGGTGLGMAIVHELVDVMEGHIEVRSRPGEGTVFMIDLPCVRTRADLDSLTGEQLERLMRPLRVLVIDGPGLNRDALEAFLKPRVKFVKTVSPGQEALQALSAKDYDCAVLELGHELSVGRATLRKLRDGGGMAVNVPVIGLQSREAPSDSLSVHKDLNDVLTKPFRRRDLARSLVGVLR